MNIRTELEKVVGTMEHIQLNNLEIDPLKIKAIMINEVVPADPAQDFYGQPEADYMTTTIPLFQKAGLQVTNIQDILQMGVYITNAVKTPKSDYTIEKSSIENSLPYLEKELALFPNIKVIMLMGDVAKKAFNMIAKKATKKNALPAISTYKLRNSEIYYRNIRVMPSYIITGGNILIEKSKFEMVSEDIAVMARIIG
ncbi:Uracil-DNA glycosylase [Clostridium cavendishii DSM 21758]|uniref:Uracil-DNA glycosylase n=1 Tax=Clostridium cavendishii DSM 21758 TaxID=1121302 RepID=A0A1M6SF12_9CLOT|nr:uracil-DNA glycosylase family protein [Clostridium cavendishii]SHK43352.1 Uracil-DNA glycosylase [Clostridium cavendishii DSM 21758]